MCDINKLSADNINKYEERGEIERVMRKEGIHIQRLSDRKMNNKSSLIQREIYLNRRIKT